MRRLFKITCLGVFLLLVGALGWVFYKEPVFRAYLCPSCFGLTEIGPHIYLEQTDDATRTQIRADVLQAQRDIEAFFQPPFSLPTMLICLTEICQNRLGGSQALGQAYGTVLILISPKGANRTIIAHELAHIAVGRQLGSLAMVSGRLPAWFFEGLAVIVSRDPRYLTFPKGGYPDVALPHSFREWRRRAGLEHAQLYPAAAFKVSQWMDQNGGVFGVRAALKALAEGEVVDFDNH